MNQRRVRGQVRVLALVAVLAATGCPYAKSSPRAEYVAPRTSEPAPVAEGILSASFVHDDGGSLSREDCIVVVFDRELDAASLRPRSFLVVLGDGTRVYAESAVLAPASEDDENRSVWLRGDFGDPLHRPPTDLVVVAPVWAEDGREILGAAVKVAAHGRPVEVVAAELIAPSETRCPGARQLIRLYWTQTITGVDGDDAQFEISTSAGTTVRPVAIDDASTHAGDPLADNVLDLCVADGNELREVRIRSGTLHDRGGRSNQDVRVTLPEARHDAAIPSPP